jgi:hypothetical protein
LLRFAGFARHDIEEVRNYILLRVRVRIIKNIATNATSPIPENKTAARKPRRLRLMTKMAISEKIATSTKSAEKGI